MKNNDKLKIYKKIKKINKNLTRLYYETFDNTHLRG